MTGKPAKPSKHIPQRTCVGCRTIISKRLLVRLVYRPDGVQIDFSGKLTGRGAYLHNRYSCWEKSLKGPLANALKTTLTIEDTQRLQLFMKTLPIDEEETGEQELGPDGLR